LGCWISPCYGPFLLVAPFEAHEPFISLTLIFVSGHGKPRITKTADTESVDTDARLYFDKVERIFEILMKFVLNT
jgi:hypothetical protein